MSLQFRSASRNLLIGLLLSWACQAADLYPVAGTVVNVATNAPLARARVYVYPAGATKPIVSGITGDDGRFRFQLAVGIYTLRAGTRDTLEDFGSSDPATAIASGVVVGPGKDAANLLFRYFPPAAISGRVLDEAGEPVRAALVQLIRSTVVEGRRSAMNFASTYTDDRGEYRFGHLAPETSYYVAVTAQPWYAQHFAALQSNGSKQFAGAPAYAPAYYPDSADASKATAIVPGAGQEAQADFTLRSAANATITITHDAPAGSHGTITLAQDGAPGAAAVVQQSQPFFAFQPAADGPRQPFPVPPLRIMSGIPPGHYRLEAVITEGATPAGALVPLEVNGSDIALNLSFKPLVRVKGVVKLPAGARRSNPLFVSVERLRSGVRSRVPVQPDGSFALPPTIPESLRFSLAGSDGFYITKIGAEGAAVKDGALEVGDGSEVTVSITASNETGSIRGFVMNVEHPVIGALAILAPASGKSESGAEPRSFAYQTDSDGSFNFRNVPAGRYYLFAADSARIEYARQEVVSPYLKSAKEIEIRTGSSLEESLQLPRR